MKILTIGFLILVMMSGQLNADENATLNKITLTLDDTSEVLVKGFIAPIGDAMSESSFKEWDELVNLRVAEPEKRYPASVFHAFLPDTPVSIGESWKVEAEGALTLLRQLHPNPRLDMHINVGDSRGLWACLRAYNDKFADIVFRIHAEFKLEDGWFTPSQFAGHLVIDRIAEKVAFFEMSVPDGPINHAEAAGSFDLFPGDAELPTEGAPRNAIVSAWGVPPGETERITHLFDRGQHFKLGATGDWFSKKGQVNAFVAKISVEPNQALE